MPSLSNTDYKQKGRSAMSIANRRIFLFKTAGPSIATGFKSWDKAENQNILYARRLNEDYGSDRTQIFYLN